jgi:ParB-like chromosome segregation protein Spo0J
VEIRTYPVEQLRAATDNPRFIRRDRLDNLKDSIQRDPSFMWRRPVLATADGTIYAGNQRYRACLELGWKQIPAILSDVTKQLAQQRGLRDNNSWGDWDDESLLAFVRDIARFDMESTATLGFTDTEIRSILAESDMAQPTPQSQLPPVDQRDRTRYEDAETEDPDDGLHVQATDGESTWQEGTIKQIILQWPADTFNGVQEKLEPIREALEVDNNTDAVTKLLEQFYDATMTGGE